MKIGLECVPCVLNQTIAASRLATDDEGLHDKILQEMLQVLAKVNDHRYAPELFRAAQRIIAKHTGVADPYKEVKKDHIEAVLSYYPQLLSFLETKEDRLYWALKASAAGNCIDLGIFAEVDIDGIIEKELEGPFAKDDYDYFLEKLKKAKDILILADNAGESVFDRMLIDHLPDVPITYAVKDKPIINDVLIEDAIASKIDATIISSGSDVSGTIICEGTKEFQAIYKKADIVISKGQGNFETLSKEDKREIFFLFKAKCALVTRLLEVQLGDYVFILNRPH